MLTLRSSVAGLALLGIALPATSPAEAQIRGRDAAIIGIGAAILGGVILNQQLQAQPRQSGTERPRPQQQPKRPTAAEASPAQTLAIQQALVDRGFDVPLDGQLGPATRNAISAYQRANRMPVTGRLTPQQTQALLGASVAVPAAAGLAAPAFADQPAPVQPFVPAPAVTPVSTQGPRILPVSPGSPEWASGTWSGTFSCRRRTYTVRMTVPVEGRGEPVVLDYRWTATAPNAGSGEGRVVMEASPGRGRLTAIRIESGEADHPFGQLRVLPDSQQNPVFTSAPCRGALALVRDQRTAPVRTVPTIGDGPAVAGAPEFVQGLPAPPAPTPAPAARRDGAGVPFFGRWQGELSCGRNQKVPVEVTFGRVTEIVGPQGPTGRMDRRDQALVAADRPGRIAVQLETFAMRGAGGHATWTRFIGEAEADGGFRFAQVSSSSQLGELRFRELRLPAGADSREALPLELSVANLTCDQLTLRRPDPLSSPQRPAVRIPPGGGSFYQARDAGARCQALIEWGSRIDTDMRNETTQYRPIDPGVLFADPEFVPVFGRPFDLAGETSLRKDALDALRECQRDPLVRPRLQGLERVARGPLSDSAWSQDDVYVAHSIRKSRAALNTLAAAQAASNANPDPVAAVVDLAKAKEVFRAAGVALFPSRRAEIVARVEDGLATRAAQVLDREIDQQRGKPPSEVIAYVSDARSLSSAVTVNIKGPQRDRVTARLLDIEAQAAAAFMTTNLAALAAVPGTLEGVRRIDALPVAATLPSLSPGIRGPHETRWTADRRAKMEQALGRELAEALSLPAGRSGLERGAAWYTAFAAAWQSYLAEPPVREALGRFFDDRKARLLAAAEDYRTAVAGKEPAERREAIAGFLLLPQDRKSPAALEYDLIAFGL